MGRKPSHQLRTEACNLAPADWASALAVAAQIDDPWYACQAYAHCGRFAPPPRALGLIDEAFRRAAAGKDPYQQLAATAWPLRALIERGEPGRAVAAFGAAAGMFTAVDPAGSRAEAAFLVFQAVVVGPRELASRALDWLGAAVRPAGHWRQRRALREGALQAVTLGLVARGDIPRLVGGDERHLRQIIARLDRGEYSLPRGFF